MLLSFGPFFSFLGLLLILTLSFQALSAFISLLSQIFTYYAVAQIADRSSELSWVGGRPLGDSVLLERLYQFYTQLTAYYIYVFFSIVFEECHVE